MRDSGFSYIGQIPSHWQVLDLKRVADLRYGLGQPPGEREDGVPIVRATDISRGKIAERDMMRVDPADVPKTRDAFLRAGEIIVVRSGSVHRRLCNRSRTP